MLKSDAIKTVLKFLGVLSAGLAGSLTEQPMLAGLVSAVGVACMALTVSGLTRADFGKAALKLSSLVCTMAAGHLQATQPVYAMLLVAVGPALAAVTVPVPGTATKLRRARGYE